MPTDILKNITWPRINGNDSVWTGDGFNVDGLQTPFLPLIDTVEGWDDAIAQDLLEFVPNTRPIAVASRAHTLAQFKLWLGDTPQSLFDLGCGTGALLNEAATAFPETTLLGSDTSAHALQVVFQRLKIPLFQMDLETCPLPDEFADGISLLNVLEHIEDDAQAICHVYRMVKPGGVAVIEVPAGPSLFDDFDTYARHYRRYTMRDIKGKIREAGFEIAFASHLGFCVYPAFWAIKRKNQLMGMVKKKHPDIAGRKLLKSGGETGSLLQKIGFAAEASLSKLTRFPFGIRCLVTARKP